jgi:hypothetical protein
VLSVDRKWVTGGMVGFGNEPLGKELISFFSELLAVGGGDREEFVVRFAEVLGHV